jgi:transcriptional regulator with XRE-family HTH domain
VNDGAVKRPLRPAVARHLVGYAGPMKRLRTWRTEQLLSIQALAAAAGVTAKTLTDIELGRSRPGYATMRRISAVLEVAPSEIAEFAAAIASHASHPERPSPRD